ncbi:hypothetical protein MADA3029_270068 [Vibrio nigripulchritudo MADA3029]|nr:hypothetical protein VIBNIMADA3020_420068 [Vibrio nigripulchritudo MADA3020]CCN56545.1 hypothetical protein VIBNIMADA3021_970040 [Vibrio nigripulchritudo MADA3021]CCN58831.1 hypothetical protein MADA3029_270068 [Vibrio nigripulchritudo MADA3029]
MLCAYITEIVKQSLTCVQDICLLKAEPAMSSRLSIDKCVFLNLTLIHKIYIRFLFW